MARPVRQCRGCIPIDRVDDLVDEYVDTKQFVEEEKPYWLNLTGGTRFAGELRFELENYFPAAHYKKAIDKALKQAAKEELEDEHLVPDGGRYADTRYAWYDPDTNTYLTHVEAGDEFASPFFEDEEDARRYLEFRAQEVDDDARYEGLSLHKLRMKKIGEAVEVLTDQAGIEDFMPDGGHQIGNPQRDEVWFWYNPAADMIIQEEVEPYEVVGLFDTEDDADRFIHQYAEQYGLDDTSHLEKYRADLSYEGQGPVLDDEDSERSDIDELEQIDLDGFRAQDS